MVRLLMVHTPNGDSFLYTYGEDSPVNEGERVKKFPAGKKRLAF